MIKCHSDLFNFSIQTPVSVLFKNMMYNYSCPNRYMIVLYRRWYSSMTVILHLLGTLTNNKLIINKTRSGKPTTTAQKNYISRSLFTSVLVIKALFSFLKLCEQKTVECFSMKLNKY